MAAARRRARPAGHRHAVPTLQKAGVTWKVYQGSDNFGDNGAQYFAQFAQFDPAQGGTAAAGNIWYDNGVATVPEPNDPELGNADNLALAIRNDVLAGTLPQVSSVVTNQRYSEHPDAAPTDGAYYAGQVLHALNADPEVFNSTLVIIDYDENDGQFDHVPPPVPPAATTDEFFLETALAPAPLPVGLGLRVPLLLVSPWTRGGWVTSEVSDHTLGHPVPRAVDDRDGHPRHLPEHQRLAAERLRRPHRRVRLRAPRVRAA